MIQRILARRYELQELIGGGGMADVYKAQDKLLDRAVAVKILHQQYANDAEFVEKFRREATAAAKLAHPNICQYLRCWGGWGKPIHCYGICIRPYPEGGYPAEGLFGAYRGCSDCQGNSQRFGICP